MHSSTFNFEREVPDFEWRPILLVVTLIVTLATGGWEIYCRSIGYAPTLNDTSDLWAITRDTVKPDSTVIIGSSRALFDLDLDELQKGLGVRPIQLALVGSSSYPILEDLANDTSFHGTVIADLLPMLYFVPAGPPLENSLKALKRRKAQTVAQRASQYLGMLLEERIAFLKQEDLTLSALLENVSLPNRAGALLPPRLPPYFATMDSERRARMIDAASSDGPLQERIKMGWLPLFSAPPPPNWIPPDDFKKKMGDLIEERFRNTTEAVKKLRARGGKIIFVRFPVTGKLKEIEDAATPKAGPWTRVLNETQVPGIYFEDYPELSGFICPEWSHLSAQDSVEFSRRLAPHLKALLDGQSSARLQ